MTQVSLFFLVLAVFLAGSLSVFIGETFAHLVIYPRRGQAKKSKKRCGGKEKDLLDLIKYD